MLKRIIGDSTPEISMLYPLYELSWKACSEPARGFLVDSLHSLSASLIEETPPVAMLMFKVKTFNSLLLKNDVRRMA